MERKDKDDNRNGKFFTPFHQRMKKEERLK